MKKNLLTVDDVTGCWAIMPTPSKPNGSDINATDTVDLDETARVAEALVASGVNGILTQGTFGEAATTTWEEKQAFLRTVVETVGGRVPVFGGWVVDRDGLDRIQVERPEPFAERHELLFRQALASKQNDRIVLPNRSDGFESVVIDRGKIDI